MVATIDPSNDRFPLCITWTTLPILSWLLPFFGHTGIGASDGLIHDFMGTHNVRVGRFGAGKTYKFFQLDISL